MVFYMNIYHKFANLAPVVEHIHGKDGVIGSNPIVSSKIKCCSKRLT